MAAPGSPAQPRVRGPTGPLRPVRSCARPGEDLGAGGERAEGGEEVGEVGAELGRIDSASGPDRDPKGELQRRHLRTRLDGGDAALAAGQAQLGRKLVLREAMVMTHLAQAHRLMVGPNPTTESRHLVGTSLNDGLEQGWENPAMSSESADWYLRDWARHFGKRQSSLVNELGWEKSRAYHVWHSKQAYRRDDVNAVAEWLGIKPYELMMPPADALALRRLRETAELIVRGGSSNG